MSTKILNVFIFLILVFLLLMPVLLYFRYFHGPVFLDIDKWGQTGSFFGGIYQPIIGFLTLALLYMQFRSSVRMERFTRDSAFVRKMWDGFEYSLNELNLLIDNDLYKSADTSIPNGAAHLRLYQLITGYEVNPKFSSDDFGGGDSPGVRIMSLWVSINGYLRSLDNEKNIFFKNELHSMCFKVPIKIGIKTSRGLDKFAMNYATAPQGFKCYFLDSKEF